MDTQKLVAKLEHKIEAKVSEIESNQFELRALSADLKSLTVILEKHVHMVPPTALVASDPDPELNLESDPPERQPPRTLKEFHQTFPSTERGQAGIREITDLRGNGAKPKLNERLLEIARRIGAEFDWRVLVEVEPQLIHRFQEKSIAPGLHKMCKDGVLLKTKEGKPGPRGNPPRYRLAADQEGGPP